MKNLSSALKDKTLEDLKPEATGSVSNLIEPTKGQIETIMGMLKEGKTYSEIKKTVRKITKKDGKQVSAQGFSFAQIKEIDLARKAKIAELTPEPEEEV